MAERNVVEALAGHRFYDYRGCAPVPAEVADFPGQSLGDPGLSVDAWTAGADPVDQEAAAVACGRCPLLEACRAEALVECGEAPPRVPEQVRQVAGGMLPSQIMREARRRRHAEYAYRALTDHRLFRYRGCAPSPDPDPEVPGQVLGDPGVSGNAWLTPYAEPQTERGPRERQALGVCAGCVVLSECRRYGLAETRGGRLAEPEDIWGGVPSVVRHRVLVARRAAAGVPVQVPGVGVGEPGGTVTASEGRPGVPALARTEQKRVVLEALARYTGEVEVAAAAGMDVRTANWQRSLLCGLLGLDRRTATRRELLVVAVDAGLLPVGTWLAPDGPRPVVAAPNGDGSRQRQLERRLMPVQLALWPSALTARLRRTRPRTTRPAVSRSRAVTRRTRATAATVAPGAPGGRWRPSRPATQRPLPDPAPAPLPALERAA